MTGTCVKPAASSAVRMAPIWPSIMALGATISAPARAWDTAVRASSSSAASLSTVTSPPISHSGPQWPWSVYSHRQVSAMTLTPGCAALMARIATWTMPWSAYACVP